MRGIAKEFLGVRVLEDVDLDCTAGEVHAIVGENGAGKSTLMKILAGAYRPSDGRDPARRRAGRPSITRSRRSRRASRSSTRSSTSCPTARSPRTSSSAREPSRRALSTARAWRAARPSCWPSSRPTIRSRRATSSGSCPVAAAADGRDREGAVARRADPGHGRAHRRACRPTRSSACSSVERLRATAASRVLYISHRLRRSSSSPSASPCSRTDKLVRT